MRTLTSGFILFFFLSMAQAAEKSASPTTTAAKAPAVVSQSDGIGIETAPIQQTSQKIGSENGDPKFREKLDSMLSRAEKSIVLLREQITQNQSAPFLANLYMQLGDLLSQKSNVLYYLQMEHDKNTDLKVQESKKFSPVVSAEQEAIAVYQQIFKEFPKFDKLDKVLYRLAVGQKSIDEGPAFVETAEQLIKLYSDSHEAIQVRLLLGQYFYDMQDYVRALSYLDVVKASAFPFERNAARYRIGLIQILQEKHKDALHNFELVATDNELKDDDNPAELNLKSKTTKNNVKREALIDSVRAYTEVFKTDADPVGYYSRVAPSEILFQETIEKLAYRYIFLKKYNFAIKLLRSLSERTSDAQKIMNIYHEVLLMIPIQDRIDVPVAEIQFVLEKYNYWSTHYTLSPELGKKSAEFFETQVRELGTRSHDGAKKETDPKRRKDLYERARQFYVLYLGFFHRNQHSVKIATNLSDVYFNQGNYLDSGSYYLRVFAGEFGAPTQKELLIQNAILALQKPSEYQFYEQLRAKGLLVKAIRVYQAFDEKKKNDPALNFALAKTYYEQGYYDHALGDLYQFMKRYPNSKEVGSASELILNYFNTRSDFKGLVDWSQRMLALGLTDKELRQHLQDVRSKALLKRLDERVKSQKGYDVFSQGKSYLQTALTAGDSSLRSAAFEQALGRSKSEKDIETFLTTAKLMAKGEPDLQKRMDLLSSMGDETLAISRYYQTLQTWRRVVEDPKVTSKMRAQVYEKMVKLALMLHDVNVLAQLWSGSNFKWMMEVSSETKRAAQQQLVGIMDSKAELPAVLFTGFTKLSTSDDDWLPLFKAQFKAPSETRQEIVRKIAAGCRESLQTPLCKWSNWNRAARDIASFVSTTQTAAPALTSVEPMAQKLNGLLEEFRGFGGSGDPQLDIFVALGTGQLYQGFGDLLDRIAQAAPEVAPILKQKAAESKGSAAKSRNQCKTIIASAKLISPMNLYCESRSVALPSLEQAFKWPKTTHMNPPTTDPRANDIDQAEKKIFVNRKDWKLYFDLAELYLAKGMWHHASATSIYGISSFAANQEEFEALLGCSVLHMGLVSEAQFHLGKASEINGHKQGCLSEIQALSRAK